MLLGAHVSIAGGLDQAFANAAEIGCDAIQLFVASPRALRRKPLADEAVDAWNAARKASPVKAFMTHDNYLINLASPKPDLLKACREAFLDEMERCHRLGIPLLVFHPGSHQGTGEEKGLKRVADGLKWALKKGEEYDDVTLCIENTAGQGDNVGYRFEHLAELLKLVDAPGRTGVCLDTCHTFTSGYDLRTEDAYRQTMAEFDRVVGLQRLRCFHLNDSKPSLGERVDRHEAIGKGKIGKKAFSFLVNDKRFASLPGILETPHEDNAGFAKDLKVLRALVGKSPPKTQLGDF